MPTDEGSEHSFHAFGNWWRNMLGQLANWFYDPLVFWGTPFIVLAAWAVTKRVRDRLQRREPRD